MNKITINNNKQKRVKKKHLNKIIGMELIKHYIPILSLKYLSRRNLSRKK